MELRGTTALVTGAAVGVGRAIAERLAAEGVAVVVADADVEAGEETVLRIRAASGWAHLVPTDVTVEADLAATVAQTADVRGGMSVLVNCAGGGGATPPHFPDADLASWSALLDLNLRAPLRLIQLALPQLQEHRGAVVSIGSSAATGPAAVSAVYAAAKAGLARATVCLAGLEQQHGVRVSCVVPHWIATPRAERELAAMPPPDRAAQPPLVPMRADADEVVRLAASGASAGQVVELGRG